MMRSIQSLLTMASVLAVGMAMAVASPNIGFLYASSNRTLQDGRSGHVADADFDTVHLNTLSAPDAIAPHLLDGNFSIVRRIQNIPANCTTILYSSFADSSGKSHNGTVEFANPNEPAQYGDSLIPNAPFRQLVFAGQNPKGCFVYYEHGGLNHPSYCLAVIDYAMKKTVWVGEIRQKAADLAHIKSLFRQRQFSDNEGPVC